jgi:hypothetical protein
LTDEIKKNEMDVGWVGRCIELLVGKTERERPLGRLSGRWVSNITMDLQKVIWRVLVWVYLAWDRDRWRALVITVMSLRDLLASKEGLCSMKITNVFVFCLFF